MVIKADQNFKAGVSSFRAEQRSGGTARNSCCNTSALLRCSAASRENSSKANRGGLAAYWVRMVRGTTMLFLLLGMFSCGPSSTYTDAEIATAWADLTLDLTKGTPGNSPTYASRCLGYIGLTMYESVAPAYPEKRSLAGQLSMLARLPEPDEGKEYNYPLAMSTGQAEILRSLYNHTSDANKTRIDSLEKAMDNYLRETMATDVADRSVSFGKRMARAIFEWSKSDGGHRAYLRNFEKGIVHPDVPGSWKPPLFAQSFSHHPLHPYWGQNRPFLPANYRMEAPEYITYDTLPGSPYYEQFLKVYEADLALTQEQKEIALWWGDDPDDTFTPPGHSYYIATQVLTARDADLITRAETYARVGIAVADAFINCWKWKYQFFSERPNTYIPAVIDEEWESFWPDPPFPAFPSGHAIQAAAAATVLEGLHGPDFVFTDRSHLGRPYDEERETGWQERPFTKFWDVALETADSRFYGGIHTPQDNDRGLEKGKEVGENVNGLSWDK
ncbi:vanadium-dependent haloperoxidase [Neolewinella persica]|uniref:vanadium-dependent haloperoxidase n=1 Tax=Neolewinella persica TaxID=70998 RepID=UPI001B7FB9E3|nr:vanadium-dependent haloperoxidase [Neolewinella persica]